MNYTTESMLFVAAKQNGKNRHREKRKRHIRNKLRWKVKKHRNKTNRCKEKENKGTSKDKPRKELRKEMNVDRK
jgi:hypothetical protein